MHYRPPYALHVGLGVFQTIGYPPNWLFSCAHDNVASVQTVGENCIANMATFPGIRARNQSAAKAYCVARNMRFGIGHGGRHDVKRHIGRAAHIAKAQSRLGSINRFVAAGCEIDKVTSAEIAFAIFIA